MTPEEFKEQVQDAVDLYLTDYFKPEIEWDFEDPELPTAYITVKLRDDAAPYILTVNIDNDGDVGVECGEESWLPADDGGFMTALFFEAHDRFENADRSVNAAKASLESLKDNVDEFVYQELASALNL